MGLGTEERADVLGGLVRGVATEFTREVSLDARLDGGIDDLGLHGQGGTGEGGDDCILAFEDLDQRSFGVVGLDDLDVGGELGFRILS